MFRLGSLIILLAIFEAKAECTSNRSHSEYFGNKGHSDRLLFNVRTTIPFKTWRWVSADVHYEPSEDVDITYIEILDKTNNKKGGCGEITSGGVKQNHVSIKFNSQWNQGLDYVVNIYGREFVF